MLQIIKTILRYWSLLLIGVMAITGASPAAASQSQNVAIIGGSTLDPNIPCGAYSAANVMGASGGGCLQLPAGFTFTPIAPADVTAANLAAHDTVVLNMASYAMACDPDNLSAQAKTDIVAFVAGGKKLIIYDSECSEGSAGLDYSWLPYPFSTANPGAQGAQGTLTIVEDNSLSSADTASPYFINAATLGSNSDAVGDMNVMTTLDPYWCIDMSGTNILGVTGPVHTYATYPKNTDQGLIIYNGLDQDYQYNDPAYVQGSAELAKIFKFELQQQFNPSLLPCVASAVGITISPITATNIVGQPHTVTASLNNQLGEPQPGNLVTFYLKGTNAGAAGACNPADCISDADGKVTFTYTGMTIGSDTINACFTNQAGEETCSQDSLKTWIKSPNQPPDCAKAYADPGCLWPPNNKMVPVNIKGVTDPNGDPVTITITSITSDEATSTELGAGGPKAAPDASGVGTSQAMIRAERSGLKDGRVYIINFIAFDGKDGLCNGSVVVNVPHDQSNKSCPAVDSGQKYDATKIN
jgi:hypothetical protein